MDNIPYLQALNHIRNVKPVFSKRTLPLDEACGWMLADPLFAKFNVPPAPVSAIDGFALCSSDAAKATEKNHITLAKTKFQPVTRGCPIKHPFDTVISAETAVSYTNTELTIKRSAKAGNNIREPGDEIKKGRLILPAGAKLRPIDIGALAEYGYMKVPVKSISVGIIPVGSNLIKPGVILKPGQTTESNSYMTAAYVRQFNVPAVRYLVVENERDKLKKAITKALKENDIILIATGILGNNIDNIPAIISNMGKLIFQGVLMNPAQSSMLGIIKGKPVLCLPSSPLGAATALRMFVRPLLEMWGFSGSSRSKLTATSGCMIETDENIDEMRFGVTAFVEGKPIALPEPKSARTQISGIRANGYIHIPRGIKSVESGNVVKAVADADADDLKTTILIGGNYSQGMETFVENAAEAGLIVKFGDGDPIELLTNKYCHAVCSDKKLSLNIPIETFSLCDGTYLIMRKDMNDSLCSSLRRFAGVI
ncbi:MAG TPA: molybdopterin molybdotransferase MoeA [Methanocorpusculum sp.]|nr:molybdopterin molybdotransferase MoeA [Methanocorpusculum sp.]